MNPFCLTSSNTVSDRIRESLSTISTGWTHEIRGGVAKQSKRRIVNRRIEWSARKTSSVLTIDFKMLSDIVLRNGRHPEIVGHLLNVRAKSPNSFAESRSTVLSRSPWLIRWAAVLKRTDRIRNQTIDIPN